MDVWSVLDYGSGWRWAVVQAVAYESGQVVQSINWRERRWVDDGVGWSAWWGWVVLWGVC